MTLEGPRREEQLDLLETEVEPGREVVVTCLDTNMLKVFGENVGYWKAFKFKLTYTVFPIYFSDEPYQTKD